MIVLHFELYNKPFLEAAVKRNEDIIIATKHKSKSDVIDASGNLKGMYAHELKYLSQNNYKPINVSESEWETIKAWFK